MSEIVSEADFRRASTINCSVWSVWGASRNAATVSS